jgi:hypothetical protein
MWVAAGSGSAHVLAYSTDGITWTGFGTTLFGAFGNGRAIAWNGSMWVAGGDGATNNIAYSTDGTTWTGLAKTIISTTGNAIAFNNARRNTITFPPSANPGLVSGTTSQISDLILTTGQTLEIVSDSYNQSNVSIVSLNIQA